MSKAILDTKSIYNILLRNFIEKFSIGFSAYVLMFETWNNNSNNEIIK